LWRCGDGLFFEVAPLARDALLTTLHTLLENVMQTVCRKFQEESGTGGFDLLIISISSEIAWGRSELYGGFSNRVPPIHFLKAKHKIQSRNADAPLRKYLVAPPS
jgi:hypothetical protein